MRGATCRFGADGAGALFELAGAGSTYAGTPTLLASLDDINLANPGGVGGGGLIIDAAGDLFGAARGGQFGTGALYELAKSGSSYASAPQVIASFHGQSSSVPFGLKTDAAGDIFCLMGDDVYEVAQSDAGYSAPVVLAAFNATLGTYPGPLVLDAAGDLFTATENGGQYGDGGVYEIAKTQSGYAAAPKLVASLPGAPGPSWRDLTMDAEGDLIGVTWRSVFEIVHGTSGYASSATLLATDDDFHFAFTAGIDAVTLDAAGDLFGVTSSDDTMGPGSVFEIARSGTGYAAPVTVATLNFAPNLTTNSGSPSTALTADASGNLFGVATYGGAYGAGVLFEVSGVGYRLTAHAAASDLSGDGKSDILFANASGALAVWEINDAAIVGGGGVGNPGSGWTYAAGGDFNDDGKANLLFRNASGQVAIWEMNGQSVLGGGLIGAPGASWSVAGTGDFNGDGVSDILFRDAAGDLAAWEMNGTSVAGGGLIGNRGAGWTFKGIGDFNGDGRSDLLFEDASGVYACWTLNGAAVVGGAVFGAPGAAWAFAGIGDFNGDGASDLLFKNQSTGVYAEWSIAHDAVSGGGVIGAPGSAWALEGIGDYRGDGKSSLLFENASSGVYATLDLNGATIVGGGVIGSPGGTYAIA